MAKSDIITGQYVKLRQTPASVSDRLLAQLIDYVILTIYSAFAIYLLMEVDESYDLIEYHPFWFYPILFFGCIFPTVFYHPVCEWLNHGQSIGKAVMKCRVVSVDGSTPTLGGYLLRWLLYPIDVLVSGGLGVIVIMFTDNNQRLGDLAAGTMVIKSNALEKQRISLSEFYYVSQGYQPTFADAANLSLRQVEVINHTLYDVNGANREQCLNRLTEKVQEFLDTVKPASASREDFLYTVLNDYYYYASTLEE
ncbi:MAG: RDD family protein [Muribaculaceae bacterium]|nr:RDD family protein [Muribaculaceae bacterium]